MYLKSLTLKGFKSFAQPTTFAFEPGVTCVVGPNGSGKSNVVDALAWVMGEQGAKTLRGGTMSDVIFAGTATRGPLGRAEVLLTIDNSDGALPIEYTEVTISRTLFRNGASEYAINGQSCRLLDVQELLSDSGLGREMHVIVGQGQLDAVLQASPEGRRGFIEEAAGILKHRRRKERTLRKLEAMQANLTRLSDLAGEVRRQLKPLGQQAQIAREAQTVAAEVRDARARLLADEVVTLRAALDDYNRSEHQRSAERVVVQEKLDQNILRQSRIEQGQRGDAVDEARRLAFGLEQAEERLRGLDNLAKQRLVLLGSPAQATAASGGVTAAQVQDAREEAIRLRDALSQGEQSLAGAVAVTTAARAGLDALDEEIAAQSALVSLHDLELSTLAGQADAADSRLAAVRGEVLRQQSALDEARQRRDAAQAQFALLEAEAATADRGESDLDGRYQRAEARVSAIGAEIDRIRDRVHEAERERDALAAKTSALSRAMDLTDGAGMVVRAGIDGVIGIVADSVQVEAGFESAVAAALGTLAEALLVHSYDAAMVALDYARTSDLGRLEIVIADADGRRVPADAVFARVPGITPVIDVIDAPDGVRALLAAAVIADDLSAARAALPELRTRGATVTIVTRAGEVLTEHVLRGGSGGKPGRIELLAERDAAAERRDRITVQLEQSRFLLAEQRALLEAAKQESATALAALRDLDAQLAAQTEGLSRVRVQVEAAAAETERLGAALQLTVDRARDAESAAAAAAAELAAASARPRPILDADARQGMLAELEAARTAELHQRVLVETARERVRAEAARADDLERQRERDRTAAEEAARLAVLRARQRDAAQRVVEALPAVLDSVRASATEARLRLAEAEASRSRQNQEVAALRAEESTLRERLQGITEGVHSLELQIYEKKLQLSGLLERAGTELGLVEEVLVAEYGPDQLVPAGPADPASADDPDDPAAAPPASGTPFVRAAVQRRLQLAERTLAQLGRVNPLALEEFAALEQRHAFLTEQLSDLGNTRRDLLRIIDELDGTMQQIFLSAFEDTRVAFETVLAALFPGGTGSISLTDPDDLLASGIEVTVKPAGKRIERLSLLSGGERSLAAVALLIAIFKARPSPFYILDEIEAALDDANLGRLLSILEDLREDSQLIVITHQKRTMEIADALYGVSMGKDGVSMVVGQRVAGRSSAAS